MLDDSCERLARDFLAINLILGYDLGWGYPVRRASTELYAVVNGLRKLLHDDGSDVDVTQPEQQPANSQNSPFTSRSLVWSSD